MSRIQNVSRGAGLWGAVLALMLTLLVGFGQSTSSAATQAKAANGAAAAAEPDKAQTSNAKKPNRAGNYNPPAGVKINNPVGSKKAKNINFNHILKSINSTPRRGYISIATWNFRSNKQMRALIRAHRRGVTVRLVMARSNANPSHPNKHLNQLQKAIRNSNNKKRKGTRKSWAGVCKSSCRGSRGIAHTKMYTFSRVGKTNNVTIFGSHNLTDTAGTWQWNDLYTVIRQPKFYRQMRGIIEEMRRDKRARPPFRSYRLDKNRVAFVYPFLGPKAKGDPLMKELNRVKCRGAARGRTSIRIAQTAMTYDRGLRLAKKLRRLWDNGCNVRIIYAMFGNKVLSELRRPGPRGGVPIQQLADDWNGDGLYDRYLHTKILTIHGHYLKQRNANITVNGSANATSTALASDEVGMRIVSKRVRKRYDRWINRMFSNPPRPPVSYREVNGRRERVAPPKVDNPYALMEIN